MNLKIALINLLLEWIKFQPVLRFNLKYEYLDVLKKEFKDFKEEKGNRGSEEKHK